MSTPQSLLQHSPKRLGGGQRSSYSHPTPPLLHSPLPFLAGPARPAVPHRAQTVLVLQSKPPPPLPIIPLPSHFPLKPPGCIIYLSLCYCLGIMKGAVGTGMLNRHVLGFCLVKGGGGEGRGGRIMSQSRSF